MREVANSSYRCGAVDIRCGACRWLVARRGVVGLRLGVLGRVLALVCAVVLGGAGSGTTTTPRARHRYRGGWIGGGLRLFEEEDHGQSKHHDGAREGEPKP